MATLYVTEFTHAGRAYDNTEIPVVRQTPVAEQTVAIGGTSAQSSAVNSQTAIVRLHTDAICSVVFGTNPTATAAKMRMAANQTEYFVIPVGASYKVAVITNS